MTTEELKDKLRSMKVPQRLYSIEEHGNQTERMTLNKTVEGSYIVYFDTESGRRVYEYIFENEEEACSYVIQAFKRLYSRSI